MTVMLALIKTHRGVALLLYLLPYAVIGYDIVFKAIRGVFNGQIFDENFLMAVATVGAFVLGYISGGDYAEAVAVMLFYQIGELCQSVAVGKSRKSIKSLMDIRPDTARVESLGEASEVDAYDVEIGSVTVVYPGERIAIDGEIVFGESLLDVSALTGESLPREVFVGCEAASGSINLTGLLKIRTTKKFEESTASKILDLVENASARKSRSEAFISRFARVYTPVVCVGALLLATLPPVISHFVLGGDAMAGEWVYRALSFLVASCPCALVISIPLSFFGGIGGASREGILIKGSNYLEALAKTKTVVFDKTGTLTKGAFAVVKTEPVNISERELLEFAAHAEASSTHPIAASIVRAYGAPLDFSRVGEVREEGGLGVVARIDGAEVAVGGEPLMKKIGIEISAENEDYAVVYVAVDGVCEGRIFIADEPKPESREAINKLRSLRVSRTVMLSGDRKGVAERVARELSIDEARGELMPADKLSVLDGLIAEKRSGSSVLFVGDGINDAPALSRADVGVAMGGIGSDAAIEAADVVIMDDDVRKLARAISISKRCLSIVRQNIVFAISVKILALLLVALGAVGMWMAIFADAGVMILAVLNAIRSLKMPKKRA